MAENLDSYTTSANSASDNFASRFLGQVCTVESSTHRFLSLWFPDGAKCASCGQQITGRRAQETFWKGHRTYCKDCGSQFSPFSGTILADSKLNSAQFEIILLCYSLQTDIRTTAALAGVLPETVETWNSKIKFWESHV